MKRINKVGWLLFTLLLIAVVMLITYNVAYNHKFFQVNAANCLTLCIALGVTFFLSNSLTARRRQKEVFFDLLDKLQIVIKDENNYQISDDADPKRLTMELRKMSNMLNLIDHYAKDFGIQEEVSFIKEKFDEYEEILGNNIHNLEYLGKSEAKLLRPLSLIDDKLFEAKVRLFDGV